MLLLLLCHWGKNIKKLTTTYELFVCCAVGFKSHNTVLIIPHKQTH